MGRAIKRTATIAAGASLSDAIEIDGGAVVGIVMPAAWTTANLTFQLSQDDTSFNNLYDELGTEKNIVAAVDRYIFVNPGDFAGCDSIKVRSGTAGTPVNQAGARTITFVLIPL